MNVMTANPAPASAPIRAPRVRTRADAAAYLRSITARRAASAASAH